VAAYRVFAMLLAVVMLGGCAEKLSEPRYLEPPDASCPAVDPRRAIPAAAPLDAGFRPVSAALCTFEAVVMASPGRVSGGWSWRRAQRAEGALDELVAALRVVPPRRAGEPACPAMARAPMFLALTDAAGQVRIPAIPADACGFPLVEVDQAISRLRWVTIDSR
jgi:hypothetical protein